MFCADHNQLCCTTCVLLDHRQCNKVTKITSEEHKKEHEDLIKLTTDVTDLTKRLMKFIEQKECNIKSIEDAFDKILEEVSLMRQKFNSALDSFEQRTVNEGRALVSSLQESLQADAELGKTALKRIQSFQEAADKIGTHDSELSAIAFMKIQSEMSKSDSFLRMTAFKSKSTSSFIPNKEIDTCFETVESFGNTVSNKSNAVITMTNQSLYTVKRSGESTCEIRCICEMSDGNIILADATNKKMKMLDTKFSVISHCDMPAYPCGVCQVSNSQVVVVVYDWKKFHAIQIIDVTNNTLVKKETFNLTHPCTGICHYNGHMYITSRTALYCYTLTGKLLDKLHEDTSASDTVYRCAVNADCGMIYVVNFTHNKVLTLDMSGHLLSSFNDPELQNPTDVHVSESGQVLVCGYYSKNIIQLNSEGTEKITCVASLKEGKDVLSVRMLRRTGYVLVGRLGTDDIAVLDVEY
ncbi:uncharacterized protein LOC127869187 isoform X1 [Dreissena polymorpha]|nr:uncharacterized protein LOC127869187 isoform X1 [Dreissena polymorpha]